MGRMNEIPGMQAPFLRIKKKKSFVKPSKSRMLQKRMKSENFTDSKHKRTKEKNSKTSAQYTFHTFC